MEFTFEGKRYRANMTAIEIYGDGRFGSPGCNIPIKLPDGRFVRIVGWMESYPPQPDGCEAIDDDKFDRYATAELI